MKLRLPWLLIVLAAFARDARSQVAVVEMQQGVGASTEEVTALASQVRVFGEPAPGLRFKVEGAYGRQDGGDSDFLGTAYSYDGKINVIEAYAEYLRPHGRFVRAVKGGRYLTPFGISASSEQAYVGFLRPPLIRYGRYYALSTGYLEHGADVVIGVPRLSAEVSVGRPGDVGEAIRRPGFDVATRVETSGHGLIVGVSFLDTTPYLPASFAFGRSRFGGVDARWMRDGVQLRGEWIAGRPFDRVSTTGGYVDLLVHRAELGPVMLLARAETLDYETVPRFALHTRRYGTGLRVRLWRSLTLAAGVTHQAGQLTQERRTVLDTFIGYAFRTSY